MKIPIATTGLLFFVIAHAGATQISQLAQPTHSSADRLTRRQAARLMYMASSSEDHHRLAEYFRREAGRERDNEQHYLNAAASYQFRAPRSESYRNVPLAAFYSRMADEARALAAADDALATFQDKLAAEK